MPTRRLMIARSVLVVTASLTAFAQQPLADEWLGKPVDDRTFKTFLDHFSYDRALPFETRSIGTGEQEGIKSEHFWFQSTPGVRVAARLYQPPGGESGKPATLIFLHGGGVQGKDGAGTVRIALNFARAGWRVLAMDMQYFGERHTDLLTTFTEEEKHTRLYNQPPVYLAWVAQTVKDVSRSIDWLAAERGADGSRVGVAGFSRGAMVVPIAAAVDKRIAAAVMLLGGHFDALEKSHLPAACVANYIGRVGPRPLLMVNALYDKDMIKETSVEPLYRLAKMPKQILWSEGGHAMPSEQNQAQMLQWLRQNLK
jgi:dienelactone hydrolase